jgi:hypothetical protein
VTYSVVVLAHYNDGTDTVRNNLFNISGTVSKVIDIQSLSHAIIENNTIYANAGGTITTGIYCTTRLGSDVVRGNIIQGCTTGITDFTNGLGGNNCFYNNTNNWTLRTGDIVANPQFRNPAAGDFTPMNPLLYDAGGCKFGAVRTQTLVNQNSLDSPFGNSR